MGMRIAAPQPALLAILIAGGLWGCFAAGLSGCLATRDLDDLQSSEGTTGGTSNTGGAGARSTGGSSATGGSSTGGSSTGGSSTGGSSTGASSTGGGAASVAAADWTSFMTAVYDFELPEPDLGHDSSGHGLDLTRSGDLDQGAVDAPQGLATLISTEDGVLEDVHPELDFPAGPSLTWGGWVNIDAFPSSANLVKTFDALDGYLAWIDDGWLKCTVAGNGNSEQAASPGALVPVATWVHVLCRYDVAEGEVSAFINGSVTKTKSGVELDASDREFRVGSGFEGQLDEVFVAKQRLSDLAVRRIYACNLDGARCTCDPDDPAKYTDCGRRHPDCGATLPPCNQPSP